MEKQIAYYSNKDAFIMLDVNAYLTVDVHPNSSLNGKEVKTTKVLSHNT